MLEGSDSAPSTYLVHGTTYAPTGAITCPSGSLIYGDSPKSDAMIRLAEISSVCNDAVIVYNSVSYIFYTGFD